MLSQPVVVEPLFQQEVLILAPTGQDSRLLAAALEQERIHPAIFIGEGPLLARLKTDAGALLLAEEALSSSVILLLNQLLGLQEAWSDIPIIVMTSGGNATEASLRVLKAFSPSGNVTLLERPFRPITLVSMLQVALRARKRQYQVRELLEVQIQATRIRDEFISVASHELRTPLTSLKLQNQLNERLLLSGNPAALAPERIRKLVETTGTQVNRLTRLVDDMLDISRISSGKLHMDFTRFDLAELVQELVERLLPQLIAVKCTVQVLAEKPVVGIWDRFRIEQVINNLLTNAIRYSPGTPVHLTVTQVGTRAIVQVRDEGIGIAAENQDRIFERFERAVSCTSISGLGLGLYICRQILETHHGSIRVESELGKGSTFIIELPMKDEVSAAGKMAFTA